MLSMMLIAATLAGAGTGPTPTTPPRITTGAGAVTVAAQAPKEQRICVKLKLTGSRVQRQKCQTRAEWIRAGEDPDSFR